MTTPKVSLIPAKFDSGGGGSDDGGVNERVAKLEAILPTLATGKDVEALRADMHKSFAESNRWTFGVVLGLLAIAVSILLFALNRASPLAPAQPIVIQLPAQPMPAPAVAPPTKQ